MRYVLVILSGLFLLAGCVEDDYYGHHGHYDDDHGYSNYYPYGNANYPRDRIYYIDRSRPCQGGRVYQGYCYLRDDDYRRARDWDHDRGYDDDWHKHRQDWCNTHDCRRDSNDRYDNDRYNNDRYNNDRNHSDRYNDHRDDNTVRIPPPSSNEHKQPWFRSGERDEAAQDRNDRGYSDRNDSRRDEYDEAQRQGQYQRLQAEQQQRQQQEQMQRQEQERQRSLIYQQRQQAGSWDSNRINSNGRDSGSDNRGYQERRHEERNTRSEDRSTVSIPANDSRSSGGDTSSGGSDSNKGHGRWRNGSADDGSR